MKTKPSLTPEELHAIQIARSGCPDLDCNDCMSRPQCMVLVKQMFPDRVILRANVQKLFIEYVREHYADNAECIELFL